MAKKLKPAIVSLPIEKYRDFLVFLNDEGTDIVYVASCYSGGFNILLFQENDLKESQPLTLSYFLVIGSVTDAVVKALGANFANFFKEINTFFSSDPTSNVTFTNILKALGLATYLENTPSVRYPGSLNYFKAVDVDKATEILTYSKSMAPVLQAKLSHKPIKKLTLKDKNAILVYPLFIQVPIEITMAQAWQLPVVISMIPGNAFHYFVNLNINEPVSLKALLSNIFFYNDVKIPSEKVVFIENFNINITGDTGLPSGELKNVIVDKKPGVVPSIMIAKVNDQFYKADITWDVSSRIVDLNRTKFEPIDIAQAKNLIEKIAMDIKNKTLPAAVKQASGGQENIEEIYRKIVNNFVPK